MDWIQTGEHPKCVQMPPSCKKICSEFLSYYGNIVFMRHARLMASACKFFFACHTTSTHGNQSVNFPRLSISVNHSLTSDGPAFFNGLRKWVALSPQLFFISICTHFYR